MSEATAKQERRNLRRAIGEAATASLDNHTFVLNAHQRRLVILESLSATMLPLLQRKDAFVSIDGETEVLRRDLIGRLKWLVRGK